MSAAFFGQPANAFDDGVTEYTEASSYASTMYTAIQNPGIAARQTRRYPIEGVDDSDAVQPVARADTDTETIDPES